MAVQVTEVQKALAGADYPANKDDLVHKAESNGASGEVLEKLRGMEDRTYDGPSGVMKALAGQLGGSTQE
jgi:hypothetical protein